MRRLVACVAAVIFSVTMRVASSDAFDPPRASFISRVHPTADAVMSARTRCLGGCIRPRQRASAGGLGPDRLGLRGSAFDAVSPTWRESHPSAGALRCGRGTMPTAAGWWRYSGWPRAARSPVKNGNRIPSCRLSAAGYIRRWRVSKALHMTRTSNEFVWQNAFDFARSGKYRTWADVAEALSSRGLSQAKELLNTPTTRRQLDQLCASQRK